MKRLAPSKTVFLFALVLLLLAAACGEESHGDHDNAAEAGDDDAAGVGDDDTEAGDGEYYLSFDLTPGSRNVPFPSIIFMRESNSAPSGYRLNTTGQITTFLDPVFEAAGLFLTDMLKMDGFGVTAPVWFHAQTPPNPAYLRGTEIPNRDDAVLCAVLEDENHPQHGKLWPLKVTYLSDVQVIQAVPYLPFAENTTYMCIVQNTLCTEFCDEYTVPDHLQYIMSPIPDPSHEEYDILEPYRRNLAPYFQEFYDQYGLSRSQLASATVFRTQWVSHDLTSIRHQQNEWAAVEPPKISGWRRVDTKDTPGVDSVWETTYQTVNWRHTGTFRTDENGNPMPADWEKVTLRLTLPKETEEFSAPFPVVLFGHGLLGDRIRSTPIYETLARNGFATVAIDWTFHGDRGPVLSVLPEFLGLVGRFLAFTPVLSPQRMRDNYRQGVADMMWLKHVVQQFDRLDLAPSVSDGDQRPDLDVETIMFAGISMGAAHGTILAAVEPDIDTYCLMSAAANWRSSVLDGNMDGFMVGVISALLDFFEYTFQFEYESEVALFYQLQLAVGEAGDPFAYSAHVLDDPFFERQSDINLLHMMPAADNITGALGEAELARSVGTTLMRPYVWRIDDIMVADTPFEGPATFQYDTDNHVFMRTPEADFFTEGHRQMGAFFRTAYQKGRATVINPLNRD